MFKIVISELSLLAKKILFVAVPKYLSPKGRVRWSGFWTLLICIALIILYEWFL